MFPVRGKDFASLAARKRRKVESESMQTTSESSLPTRWTLIRRLKELGDTDAWQEFFDLYQHLIYNVALKAGLYASEAEEVVQETFITVSKKIPQFKASPEFGRFKHWLLQIARYRILDQLRKRSPMSQHGAAKDSDSTRTSTVERVPDPASLDWEAVWDRAHRESVLQIALEKVKQQVDPAQFQLYDYYVLRQVEAARVAHILQVSLARVYLAKYRIGKLLKKAVAHYSRAEL